MNSPKVIKVLEEVIAELKALPPAEFRKLLDEHKNGEVAQLLEKGWQWYPGPMRQGMICASCGYGWWSFDHCCGNPTPLNKYVSEDYSK